MQNKGAYNQLNTRGKTQDDIFLRINKSVTATVVIPANTKVRPGDLLVTADGGKTFRPAYLNEYDNTKLDYVLGAKVVFEGITYKALVDAPEADTISDNTKWKDEGAFVVNGSAMITFERETKDTEESFKCAVAVDCELLAHEMYEFNESCRVAGFPNILMK
ncbi:MAG: hypothetical protein AB7D41_03650 [Arcobacter sp.]|uniref:hypothetical protein n=1 Tax=Arcobacter sp. TaxID=1872629 RepID=UPI003CFD9791